MSSKIQKSPYSEEKVTWMCIPANSRSKTIWRRLEIVALKECHFWHCLNALRKSPEGFPNVPDVFRLEQHVLNFVLLFS